MNNLFKFLVTYIITLLPFICIAYLLGCLSQWSFNPAHWTELARSTESVFVGFVAIILISTRIIEGGDYD